MKLRRKISLVVAVALTGATVGTVAAAAPALAAGNPASSRLSGTAAISLICWCGRPATRSG
jgi:hypothetical protein